MAYAGLPDLSGKLRSRIDELLDPNAPTPDAAARSAAQNLASGQAPGSQFGANRGLILRDTELRDRYNQANTMLQPFLQRESSESIATQAQNAENQRLITQGQQAMERLQLEQQGAGDRLSAQLRAQLEQQAAEGNQAMERLKFQSGSEMDKLRFSEGSATDRARMGIEAQMAERLASENGMNSRQSVQLENALKIAGLETDSRRQLQILQEAGLDSRQAAAIAGQMSQQRLQGEQQLAQTRLQGQNQLAAGRQSGIAGIIQTLLSSAGKGAGGGGASALPQREMGFIPVDINGHADTNSAAYKNWAGAGDQSGGSRNSALIDQLLQYYGVTPGRDLSGYF